MKTIIGLALACLLFSCEKETRQTEKKHLTLQEKTTRLKRAVSQKMEAWNHVTLFQREGLNLEDREREEFRISIAESSLLHEPDLGSFKLKEVIARNEQAGELSFGYIQADEAADIQSADGAFNRPQPQMLIFTGYMLFNDGCFHHGTFYVSQTSDYMVFWPDNGTNNNGAGSTGFEDFCLDDETFAALC